MNMVLAARLVPCCPGRQQETEAEQFGLIFAAMAGYDPCEALPFWQRMSAAGRAKSPEF